MAERAPALLYFAGLLLVTAQARTTAQPMDIGIKMTNPHGVTREGYYDLVKQADRLGYHSVWIGERWAWDRYVTLTHRAEVNERKGRGGGTGDVVASWQPLPGRAGGGEWSDQSRRSGGGP